MKQPYDERGRMVSGNCPNLDCGGTLQDAGDGNWECDGLVDPGDPNKELEACAFSHQDGTPYNATPEQYSVWAVAKGKIGYSVITGQKIPVEQRVAIEK